MPSVLCVIVKKVIGKDSIFLQSRKFFMILFRHRSHHKIKFRDQLAGLKIRAHTQVLVSFDYPVYQ